MNNDFLKELRTDDFELYVQNILPGPLVLPDLNGLTLNRWETADLSLEDRELLTKSKSLRIAVKKGFLKLLNDEEYMVQTEIYEDRVDDEYEEHLEQIEADGIALDVEVIDLNSGARPNRYKRSAGERRASRRSDRNKSMNDPEVYAQKYNEIADKQGVTDPEMFKEMVDNEEITVDSRGRKIRGAKPFNPEEYAAQIESGEIEDPRTNVKTSHGESQATVMTEAGSGKVNMSNFNRDGMASDDDNIEMADLSDE